MGRKQRAKIGTYNLHLIVSARSDCRSIKQLDELVRSIFESYAYKSMVSKVEVTNSFMYRALPNYRLVKDYTHGKPKSNRTK